ncbi:tyramine oxidase subunit B [Sporomusa malonica]|uniref:Ornithine cyclodeaminase n=1 Tax=Sporomusa malonica TaxID=112901 RepID=A0A1W1ZCZ3_9FIRM|nr:tyramine oxidase subunit B [Sporomusa malonica]SMC46247.1 ornithine cyclodeaminase [Sporomusa malonica]
MQGKKTSFLYLSEEDMLKAGVLDGGQCLETIDEMFKLLGQGDYIMGGLNENEHGLRLYFPVEKRFPNMPIAGPDRRFLTMPAYLGGKFNICACKWYGSNIENTKKGLPRSVLVVILNNVETGEPVAFMSANLLSAMRTGCVPAVGAKYLATKGADTVGLIGAGVISRATVTCLKAALPNLKLVKVYDLYKEKAEAFGNEMSKQLGIELKAADSMEDAVSGSDFISIATAGAAKPKIETKWVKDGAVLATQGTADLSDDLFLSSTIVFDEIKMHQAWKEEEDRIPEHESAKKLGFPGGAAFRLVEEGKKKQEDMPSLGEIATGKKIGRRNDKEKFVLIVGGLPVEDAAWGYALYQNALKMGIGQELVLWDSPHWA